MRISYYSPKKNVKTFSFANLKPVLIFTAEKNKESDKVKDNIFCTNVKKKLNQDDINKPNFSNSEFIVTNINKPNQINIQNGNFFRFINISNWNLLEKKIYLQNIFKN